MKSLRLVASILSNFASCNIEEIVEEVQNAAYEGTSFKIRDYTYRSRLAKLTPKKDGYFVVFWEKDGQNKNQAYRVANAPDKLIISVIDGALKGQFIFPRDCLLKQGILSDGVRKGKMAIRVYPGWCQQLNPSARRTQDWQAAYFMDLSAETSDDLVAQLYF